ncbi:hypothetical protein CJU90_5386 [Yarrowia sp. C11]|nr:hypothetical protein CJU90_5386 [Yarrowia sp. C11]KAG5363983.1 hypothetical protein CKK34_2765 [Yarrowia sp. E02]
MIDSIRTPPTTLRVKRKRGQDPLQALLVDSLKKNNKNPYVFTYSGTEETQPAKNDTVLLEEHMRQATGTQKRRQSVSVDDDADARRVFRLPRAKKQKRRQSSDAGVSAALTDMVQNYLQMDPSSSSSAAQKTVISPEDLPPAIEEDTDMTSEEASNMKGPLADSLDPDAEVEDYVYDIYYRHRNAATTSYEGQRIGFIDAAGVTDDEDSNAEDFYRNDYPDDDDVSSIDSEASDIPRFGNEFFDDRFATGTRNTNDDDYFAGDYGPSDDEDQRKPWDKQKSIPEEDEWSEDEDGVERDRLFSELEHYVENR